ncbi:signal recognition particle-docking protein FtsY [Candidatus Micrarchaeota archaeon CG_4_10_14_0_2_um_filter_49_7]|nr:MAG: hypothetical protein AUJ13_03165 [Candidatus Micrarchaeota archaeon CG1_02_49_24]PIZ92874.1 MAG: signal recognition particle-docking protein FtsY [Candidatus Micrarchaeota archaeon CG_4_10_14_0_2_um_filter_49_7]
MFDIIKKKLGQFVESLKISAVPAQKERPIATVSISTKFSNLVTTKAAITESDIDFNALETSFLEADIPYEVATLLITHIRGKLVGMELGKGNLEAAITCGIKDALAEILEPVKGFDLLERIFSSPSKPYKILFIGVNGTGKTTTIAKLAHLLKKNGRKVVLAACDTFRSGAIEQLGYHAEKIGVEMIRSKYNADPASVAFDAVKHAGALGADVVLIDTAGRQDTKVNLLDQLAKMERVIKPDLKVFVAEAISANSDVQVKQFSDKIRIDALILTKADCDSKGSIFALAGLGIPILYIGTGQAYSDLEKFEPAKVVGKIL